MNRSYFFIFFFFCMFPTRIKITGCEGVSIHIKMSVREIFQRNFRSFVSATLSRNLIKHDGRLRDHLHNANEKKRKKTHG